MRKKEKLFVAEGTKVVGDLLRTCSPTLLIATDAWWSGTGRIPQTTDVQVSEEELRRTSFLQHPQQVIGLFPLPDTSASPIFNPGQLCLALDGIQDPGNLGTIIRIADWFGIDTILCSSETADAFSPKTVQATMGSIAHVHLHYGSLPQMLSSLPASMPVYGTFLDGCDIYRHPGLSTGVIVMGNEGNGISPAVAQHVDHRLLIPRYATTEEPGAESLNVAIATAITCAEFRRREALVQKVESSV